jgi:hypothetical protein
MKSLFITLSLIFVIAFTSNAQFIKYPFGNATTITAAAPDTLNYTFTATNSMTYVVVPNTVLVDSLNIGATLSSELKTGAVLIIAATAKTGATRKITWSSSFTAVADTVPTAKTVIFNFFYNGSKYVQLSRLQVD